MSHHLPLLPSQLSRLQRESDMLDTIISMMGDERLDSDNAHGTRRRTVVAGVARRGFELASAVDAAAGVTATDRPLRSLADGEERQDFRASHRAVVLAARELPGLPDETEIEYDGLSLRVADVVPQRIAEVVLANEAVSSLWSLDEADPDSVGDALDALVRRLQSMDDIPGLTLSSMEGDTWTVGDGNRAVHGTREFLAGWLAFNEGIEKRDLPELPRWVY